ncbi:Iron-sulfur assembly protein 1 [Zancudomyces culisetae]|uniref:Iron-sulfur assembly protein 1 n=1 Tax=Zancudomyces culisetae TaxID=1213189 RepID=A0A1R1PV35_ZANCU|nr:Iron-sulfur assembly protein 1 [Zancudomyces culisetae]|eukprot:OMH84811.1 Iron-sulfur assembly protein 1 [Zancudomyces culisetae]
MSAARVTVRIAEKGKRFKELMRLTPKAVNRLQEIYKNNERERRIQYLKVGIQGKGCSGNAYTMSWVEKPEKFDEKITQDGKTCLLNMFTTALYQKYESNS